VRQLLRLRSEQIAPLVPEIVLGAAIFDTTYSILRVRWPLRSGEALQLHVNMHASPQASSSLGAAKLIHSSASAPADGHLAAWEVRSSIALS
jgi:hypothetical protein